MKPRKENRENSKIDTAETDGTSSKSTSNRFLQTSFIILQLSWLPPELILQEPNPFALQFLHFIQHYLISFLLFSLFLTVPFYSEKLNSLFTFLKNPFFLTMIVTGSNDIRIKSRIRIRTGNPCWCVAFKTFFKN